MLAEDLFSFLLRIGELIFSTIVAGINGAYLHDIKGAPAWSKKRFIYTEVIAAIGILFSLLFLIPFASSFIHWPVDLLLFVGFMVAFGLLANFIAPMNCGSIWNWHGITGKGVCSRFKADIAFCFLASIVFLASAILGFMVIRRHRTRATAVAGDGVGTNAGRGRRKWYRSSRV
jgi:hypothetical protein